MFIACKIFVMIKLRCTPMSWDSRARYQPSYERHTLGKYPGFGLAGCSTVSLVHSSFFCQVPAQQDWPLYTIALSGTGLCKSKDPDDFSPPLTWSSAAASSRLGGWVCAESFGPLITITSSSSFGSVVTALPLHSPLWTLRQSQYTRNLAERERK